MTPAEAKTIADFLLPQIEQELIATRNVIAAVPENKADYTPNEKNMTALKLAAHIATVEVWFLESVAAGNFDISGEDQSDKFKSIAEILAFYDANLKPGIEKCRNLIGEHLAQDVDFFGMKFPNVMYLQFCIKHSVHHRGQLSAYLRPMGAKVPSIYGGSADEPFQMASDATA